MKLIVYAKYVFLFFKIKLNKNKNLQPDKQRSEDENIRKISQLQDELDSTQQELEILRKLVEERDTEAIPTMFTGDEEFGSIVEAKPEIKLETGRVIAVQPHTLMSPTSPQIILEVYYLF